MTYSKTDIKFGCLAAGLTLPFGTKEFKAAFAEKVIEALEKAYNEGYSEGQFDARMGEDGVSDWARREKNRR